MAAAAQQGGGNLLTRKLGPLPTWAWLLIVTGLFGGYYLLERNKAKSAAAATAAPATTAASSVPDYVFQNYNQIPPTTPAPKPPPSAPKPPPQSGPVVGPAPAQPVITKAGFSTGNPIGSPLPISTYGGPNLMGLTLAQAQLALKGTRFYVNHDSTGGAKIVSFTPYTSGAVDIG